MGKTRRMVSSTFYHFFWDSFDCLGLVIVGSLLWFLTAIPLVTAPAAASGLFLMFFRSASGSSDSTALFFQGFRQYLRKSLVVAVIDFSVLLLILFNFAIGYHIAGISPLLSIVVFGANFWALIIWCLIQIYLWPLIVQEELVVSRIVKNAFLLVIENPIFSLAISFQAILITAVCLLTVLAVPLLLPGLLSVLFSNATEEVRANHGAKGRDRTTMNRSLKDLLPPRR